MEQSLFTVIVEFRYGTYVAQVMAGDEREAMRRWASPFAEDRPAGKSSSWLAKAFLKGLDDDGPMQLEGLVGVWCATAVCGDSLAIANIVRTR